MHSSVLVAATASALPAAPAACPLLTLPTVVTHRAQKKKREGVRKLCGAASRARPKGERWLEEPFRASCPKLGARSSAPQCVAGSDVAEQQRSVATDDVAKRMAQTTKTKRGETPAAGWIEGPAPRGGG